MLPGLPAISLAEADTLPAPKTVRVRMSMTEVHAPDALSSARYRLGIHAPSRIPALLDIVKPDRGYTQSDFRSDVRRAGRPGGMPALKRLLTKLRYFGGAVVAPGRTGALWETLYSGRYWAMAPTVRPRGLGLDIETIRVHGTPAATRFPRVSANATGTAHGLRLERRIPRRGRILIRNNSTGLDAVFLLPLKPDATYADFIRWVRHPRTQMPVRFRGARLTSTLSPDAGYVLRYQLHPAEYVVFSASSLNSRRIREAFQPLTVPRGDHLRRVGSSWRAPGDGFRNAPGLTHRVERWRDSTGIDATRPSGLAALRRSLRPMLAPTFR